jgi:outer membrane protein OmpA-like peptidoglycan-associated protein
MKSLHACVILLLATSVPAFAQEQAPGEPVRIDPVPVFRSNVVSHTTKAVNYQYRSGATIVKFGGTALMPKARGQAKVESKKGYTEIEVEFENIPPATSLGSSYLTYVLWAITPEGSATNLGELLLNDTGKSKVNVTTRYQSFAMIVTAEPHFAVRQPSELLVMDNTPAYEVKGAIQTVDAKFELLKKENYPPLEGTLAKPGDKNIPLLMLEARNAVRIATEAGAPKYVPDVYQKATKALDQSEDYHKRKQTKPAMMIAREAAQQAEDARAIAVTRIEDERIAKEKADAAARQAEAEARAAEARQRELEAKLASEEEARRRAEADAQRARAEENARKEAADRAAADEARRLAEERAEAEKRRAADEIAKAEAEKAALRLKLFEQFSRILETRDTDRGLVVNMSDVLFDFGKFSLRPVTREKLARVAGILLNYPDLKIDAEGHTDNVGSDEFNQSLSEKRASTVIEFLKDQGIDQTHLTSKGLGKSMPVVPNTNAKNRQQNRRVELIISGEVIGHNIAEKPPQPAVQ